MQTFTEPELELCWGTVYGASIEQMIQAAAENNVSAIAVSPAQYAPLDTDADALKRVLGLMDKLGVKVSIVDPLCRGLPGVPQASELDARVSWMVTYDEDFCFRAAKALRAETVNIVHYRGPKMPLTTIADAARRVCDHAARENMRVGFEFFPESGVPDFQTAVELVSAVGAPNFGIMFDVLHFHRFGGQASQLDKIPPGIIGGIQLSDRKEPPPGFTYVSLTGRCLPGEGDIPLRDILLRLLPQSPGIRVGVEIFSAELQKLPPGEATRLAMEASRRVLHDIRTSNQ